MSNWLRNIRTALLTGLAWGIAWAPLALIIGLTVIDPDNSMDEMWPVIGAYPGFLCGVVFITMLAATSRGFRLAELTVMRAGAFGALAGLLIGVLPFLIGTPGPDTRSWLPAAVMASFAVMSALSAMATVVVARARRGGAVRAS